jgi:hypothetical protein
MKGNKHAELKIGLLPINLSQLSNIRQEAYYRKVDVPHVRKLAGRIETWLAYFSHH